MKTAKEYYESKEWGNPHWDRKTANQFDKSEMLDFAEHYLQASQKWVAVEDEEPTLEENVLLYGGYKKHDRVILIGYLNQSGEYEALDGGVMLFKATHWQPLPKKPKQ